MKDETEAAAWAEQFMPAKNVPSYLAGIENQVTEFLNAELVSAMVDSLASALLAQGTLTFRNAIEAMGEASDYSG